MRVITYQALLATNQSKSAKHSRYIRLGYFRLAQHLTYGSGASNCGRYQGLRVAKRIRVNRQTKIYSMRCHMFGYFWEIR